jgi:hypothetical protein
VLRFAYRVLPQSNLEKKVDENGNDNKNRGRLCGLMDRKMGFNV